MFDIDSEKVLTLLKELCLDTEAETWFRNIKCGRKAMQALQRHYDGPDESKRRMEEARAKITNTFYKHEDRLRDLRTERIALLILCHARLIITRIPRVSERISEPYHLHQKFVLCLLT